MLFLKEMDFINCSRFWKFSDQPLSLKSIFYKIDIGKSFMSKIPLFLPRFFVNIIYQKRPQYQHFSAHEGGGGSKVQKICLKNRDWCNKNDSIIFLCSDTSFYTIQGLFIFFRLVDVIDFGMWSVWYLIEMNWIYCKVR